MKTFNNLKIVFKLTGGFLVIAIVIVVVAGISFFNLKNIYNYANQIYQFSALPIDQLGVESNALSTLRGDLFMALAIPEQRDKAVAAIHSDIMTMELHKTLYETSVLGADEKDEAANFGSLWNTYKENVNKSLDSLSAGDEDSVRQSLMSGDLNKNYNQAASSLSKLIDINRSQGETLNNQANGTFSQSSIFIAIATLVGLILAIILGLILSRSISNVVKLMVKTAEQIAQTDLLAFKETTTAIANNDLTQSVIVTTKTLALDSKDEMGDLARAFNLMITHLQEVGNNFSIMTANLSTLVGQMTNNANSLNEASSQLASSAGQAGQATNQISVTIQQVAKGITQQTESVGKLASSAEQMDRAIIGVAKGAQEQSKAIVDASNITNQINSAIQKVSENAKISADGATQAAATARNGTNTVEETITGMQSIKAKVGLSAEKVQEMGKRSDQIGMIVETIDDIASQTNLLALNAAIEAARAGEHGKGFAVVADEVRKLAERSSTATKEIGSLIKGIQQTVDEAVLAMNEGAAEVERGVERAGESGKALKSIQEAVETVNRQVEEIVSAAQGINVSSNKLVVSMDSVSAIVEENTAATEQMAASSSIVTQAVDSIASVSEQNSAAMEQVSASTEEMTAQVEEVTASSETLSQMAQNLANLVARFRLN